MPPGNARQMTGRGGLVFSGPLVLFFGIELQAALAANREMGQPRCKSARDHGWRLALACLPLAPIPAFIGAQLGARFAAPREDDVDG